MMKIILATSQFEVPAGGQACSLIRFTDDKACRQLSTLTRSTAAELIDDLNTELCFIVRNNVKRLS